MTYKILLQKLQKITFKSNVINYSNSITYICLLLYYFNRYPLSKKDIILFVTVIKVSSDVLKKVRLNICFSIFLKDRIL